MAFGGFLKQSTAVDILIGPFVDETDGKTAETGLTLAQADIKLSKNGQALAQKNDDTTAVHDSDGYYNCELNATDTNSVGQLIVIIHKSGALPCRHEYQVVEEDIYIALFATTGNLGFNSSGRVDIGAVAGFPVVNDGAGRAEIVLKNDAITAAKYDESTAFPVKSDDTGATQIARVGADGDTLETLSDQIDAVPTASEVQAEMEENGASVLDTLKDDLVDGGRLDLLIDAIKAKTDNLPADPADDSDIDAQLATIAAYLDTEIAAIKAKTDNLPADPADDSDIDAQLATIAAYLDTEIAAIKAKTDNIPASPAAVGSEMTLEDDAITSGKFDESTAHPVTTAMQKAGSTIVTGTVSHDNTVATTTVFYSDDITEATADHYNGRIVIFTSGPLKDQATDITDYELDTGEGKFTVTALTEAPGDNVTFVIV